MSADRSGQSGIRATDANRTAVSAALDSALADGQLNQFEHLDRVKTAMQATYVSELRALLSDLQGVSADLPGGGRGSGWRRASSSSTSPGGSDADRRPAWLTRILAGVPFLVIGFIVAIVLVTLDDLQPPDRPTTTPERVGSDSAAGSPVDPVVLDTPPPLTLEGLERIFSTAAAATGSEIANRVLAHPESASVNWNDTEHPSRDLAMSYRGGWSDLSDSSSSDRPSFRLADLDAAMIAPIIAGAPETLGVPDGATTHIIIEADEAGMPTYSVYAADEFHQSGYLEVNHLGEPIRVYPAR